MRVKAVIMSFFFPFKNKIKFDVREVKNFMNKISKIDIFESEMLKINT